MKNTVQCSNCGTEYSADLSECPNCAKAEKKRTPLLPALIGGCLLATAFIGGVVFNITAAKQADMPIATPEAIETLAPTPTPTPTVTDIHLYAFGRELGSDGFTAYVGDKPFTLSIELDPAPRHPSVSWSMSDSASLIVSNDGLSCEFTALKPSGKNELQVQCFGAEIAVPVYLWER